jgi:hypothetical protein
VVSEAVVFPGHMNHQPSVVRNPLHTRYGDETIRSIGDLRKDSQRKRCAAMDSLGMPPAALLLSNGGCSPTAFRAARPSTIMRDDAHRS